MTITAPLRAVPKLTTPAQKSTHTTVDTIMVTPDLLKAWKSPPFQRPLRVNAKVQALSEQIKADGGVIPGVLTVGVLEREKYLLDGQHRREAYYLSGCAEGFVDVRLHHFEDMAAMGEEFVNLNSQLVRMRPDDILRGLEGTIDGLGLIRKKCPFVGYDMIRRGTRAPILSMSQTLRCWGGSVPETPTNTGAGAAARALVLTVDEAQSCVDFLLLAERAWGRDLEYSRLWGSLNLTLCMWLYRRLVVATTAYSARVPRLTRDLFAKCLMSLSADTAYLEWLVGRQLSERDRSPAYSRIKALMLRRYEAEVGSRPVFPAPPWASHQGGGHKRREP